MNEDFPCHSDQRRKQTSFTSIIIYSTKQLYVAPTQEAKVLALQSDHVGVLFSKICCRLMLMMSAVLLQKQLVHYLRYGKLWHLFNLYSIIRKPWCMPCGCGVQLKLIIIVLIESEP